MKTRTKPINTGNINNNIGTSTKTQHKNHEDPLNINEDHGEIDEHQGEIDKHH